MPNSPQKPKTPDTTANKNTGKPDFTLLGIKAPRYEKSTTSKGTHTPIKRARTNAFDENRAKSSTTTIQADHQGRLNEINRSLNDDPTELNTDINDASNQQLREEAEVLFEKLNETLESLEEQKSAIKRLLPGKPTKSPKDFDDTSRGDSGLVGPSAKRLYSEGKAIRERKHFDEGTNNDDIPLEALLLRELLKRGKSNKLAKIFDDSKSSEESRLEHIFEELFLIALQQASPEEKHDLIEVLQDMSGEDKLALLKMICIKEISTKIESLSKVQKALYQQRPQEGPEGLYKFVEYLRKYDELTEQVKDYKKIIEELMSPALQKDQLIRILREVFIDKDIIEKLYTDNPADNSMKNRSSPKRL